MHKHFLTFGLVLILGCKSDKIPEHILGVNKMANILIDIHLAEGKVEEMRLQQDTAKIYFDYFEQEIFDKHGVDPDNYKESLKYHIDNIKTLDQIYAIVLDSLNLRREVTKID